MQNGFEPALLSVYPSSTIKADMDKILVAGESAGGYLAAQSMLLHPEANIAAVILVYPMVHLRDRFWDESYEKPMFGSTHVCEHPT
jgi:acetyl esterase/lipase